MIKLAAWYADLWNIGSMVKPEAMAGPLASIEAACDQVGRDPATIGVTALIGLWFPDLQEKKPGFSEQPLTGTVEEIAAARAATPNSACSTSSFSACRSTSSRCSG
jgi:alkanesulfonate monooxygenase SsuD/methylene tetrahydromethanopterin reductase-like flavin-dependent oxidoreductase (luciferase family)